MRGVVHIQIKKYSQREREIASFSLNNTTTTTTNNNNKKRNHNKTYFT